MFAPDPLTQAILDEARRDESRAAERGQRLNELTTAILDALMAAGMYGTDQARARPLIFHVLADDIYGTAAIDIPRWS